VLPRCCRGARAEPGGAVELLFRDRRASMKGRRRRATPGKGADGVDRWIRRVCALAVGPFSFGDTTVKQGEGRRSTSLGISGGVYADGPRTRAEEGRLLHQLDAPIDRHGLRGSRFVFCRPVTLYHDYLDCEDQTHPWSRWPEAPTLSSRCQGRRIWSACQVAQACASTTSTAVAVQAYGWRPKRHAVDV